MLTGHRWLLPCLLGLSDALIFCASVYELQHINEQDEEALYKDEVCRLRQRLRSDVRR